MPRSRPTWKPSWPAGRRCSPTPRYSPPRPRSISTSTTSWHASWLCSPKSQPYFGKDALTDKPARFFVTEIIREKILLNYDKEVPYSTEVIVEKFDEKEGAIHIMAVIYVERDSQKGILIGKGGTMLKRVGTEARKDIETFFDKSVYLELFVKVEPNWRNRENKLRSFGYIE